jgi:hypothetical protein
MLEALVFFAFLGILVVVGLLWNALAARRDRRRRRFMDALLPTLRGLPETTLRERFGAPFEEVPGSSGRKLLVWKSPPSRHFPKGSGLLTLTVTCDAGGRVEEARWRDRVESV